MHKTKSLRESHNPMKRLSSLATTVILALASNTVLATTCYLVRYPVCANAIVNYCCPNPEGNTSNLWNASTAYREVCETKSYESEMGYYDCYTSYGDYCYQLVSYTTHSGTQCQGPAIGDGTFEVRSPGSAVSLGEPACY